MTARLEIQNFGNKTEIKTEQKKNQNKRQLPYETNAVHFIILQIIYLRC